MKLELIAIGVAIAGILAVFLSQTERPRTPETKVAISGKAVRSTPAPIRFSLPQLSEVSLQPIAEEMDALHSEGSFPQDDVDLVALLVEQYRRAFGQNPVGLNEEIVAALAGRNASQAALISPEHPAIDDKGRLLDRWKIPYFFHQNSADKMEITSAGPDGKLFTADDISSVDN